MRRLIRWLSIALLGAALAIQLVPYGRDHQNPPVRIEPAWDSLETRSLAEGACFDCHSNETKWPWYSNIAPLSWLIQRDVEAGRDKLNWSEIDGGDEGDDLVETLEEGSMPPASYKLLHSRARLTDDEMARLISGLATTFGSESDSDSKSESDDIELDDDSDNPESDD